jgi:hypothetical protein
MHDTLPDSCWEDFRAVRPRDFCRLRRLWLLDLKSWCCVRLRSSKRTLGMSALNINAPVPSNLRTTLWERPAEDSPYPRLAPPPQQPHVPILTEPPNLQEIIKNDKYKSAKARRESAANRGRTTPLGSARQSLMPSASASSSSSSSGAGASAAVSITAATHALLSPSHAGSARLRSSRTPSPSASRQSILMLQNLTSANASASAASASGSSAVCNAAQSAMKAASSLVQHKAGGKQQPQQHFSSTFNAAAFSAALAGTAAAARPKTAAANSSGSGSAASSASNTPSSTPSKLKSNPILHSLLTAVCDLT